MEDGLFMEYERRKQEIRARLDKYRHRGAHASDDEIFKHMCLCICSPQTDYDSVPNTIEELERSGLLFAGGSEEIAQCLKSNKIRFPKNKANYIIENRSNFFGGNAVISLRELINISSHKEPLQRRQFIRKAILGFGMKETSEFLRNHELGSDYAILDSRVMGRLKQFGVIQEIPEPLTKSKYLEVEAKMREWAVDIKIPLDELDILLWEWN